MSTTGRGRRDAYFYTPDVRLTPPEVLEAYAAWWNVGTTFAAMRSYLGLETRRGWCARTVRRAEPCLFGLYRVVASLYEQLPAAQAEVGVAWEGKTTVTFSDAITAVRRWLWTNWAFEKGSPDDPFTKLPESLRRTLRYALAPAA